jgi:hypothetical protein
MTDLSNIVYFEGPSSPAERIAARLRRGLAMIIWAGLALIRPRLAKDIWDSRRSRWTGR